MGAGLQWAIALVAGIAGGLTALAAASALMSLAEWVQAKVHAYRTRRRKLRW